METTLNTSSIPVKLILKFLSAILITAGSLKSFQASATIPRPDKIVICVLENHGYPQVMKTGNAPYLDHLSAIGANMMEYYALTHPSQPNYIMMFSGSNQSVTNNNLPSGTPFSTPNLGAKLIQAGFTFKGYSEDLPTAGSTVAASGSYARKHSPWVHWQGNGTNQIPASCNLPFSEFPSDFNQLPDVSFVIPNQDNDMHNGSDPARIITGDEWVEDNLSAYINWARSNNSLFVLLFDEDNGDYSNRVPCIFVGPMVEAGDYLDNGYHHYDFLRTLEEMYGLPYTGNTVNATPITEIWRLSASVNEIQENKMIVKVAPNPVTSESRLIIENDQKYDELQLQIFNITGSLIKNEVFFNIDGVFSTAIKPEDFGKGIYFFSIHGKNRILSSGKLLVD